MNPSRPLVRPAEDADIPALLGVYRPYVEGTAVSFELEPPSLEDFGARVRKYRAGWAFLVVEEAGQVLGYAYGCPLRDRPAYRWSVETSVYLPPEATGRGLGRALYDALLPQLTAAGYANAFAGIALPNPASVALHRACGFERIGSFSRAGFKFGAWHDVEWYHRELRREIDPSVRLPCEDLA